MSPKWFLILMCSLSLNLTYGSSDVSDSVTPNVTDTKQWRSIKFTLTTTASTTRKVGLTTTRKGMTTTKKGPTKGTTKRVAQLVVAPAGPTRTTARTSTTSKRSGQQTSKGPTGRTTTTMRRTTQSFSKSTNGAGAKSTTTREPPRTMPPLPTMKGYTTASTTKARGVPEKIKQGATTRRGGTTTTKRTIRTTVPVLLRMNPGVTALSSLFSFFGQPMYSPPIAYGLPPATTDASRNLTTTVDPTRSTTVETSTPSTNTTTVATVDNSTTITTISTTTSNGTVEYEDAQEVIPTPQEYDYPEEGELTTSAVTLPPVTEPTHNGTSTIGPNMIRKRRKKTTISSATTPITSSGVVRIKVRRKKTTIAPVTEAVPENGA